MALNVLLEAKNPHRILMVAEMYNIAKKVGFKYAGCPIWADRQRPKNTAWGSFMLASNPYIYNPYEVVLLLYKQQWGKEPIGKSTISKSDFVLGTQGIWDIHPENIKNFPVAFPVKLAKLVIELLSYEGDIVLDPFIGSGTTAVACVQTNRKYIGIEISKKYVELAKQRIRSTQPFII